MSKRQVEVADPNLANGSVTELERVNAKNELVVAIDGASSTAPLPSGAATSAKQDAQTTDLDAIKADEDAINAKLPAATAAADGQALPSTSWLKSLLFGNDGSGGGSPLQMLRAGLTAVSSTFTGMLDILPWSVYHSTPTTRSTGQGGPLESDSGGNLRMAEQFAPQAEDNTNNVFATMVKPLSGSTYCATLYTFFAANATKANIKASAANAFSVTVSNANASTRYFQLHNKGSAPAAADVPLVAFAVPAATTLVVGREWFSQAGVSFGTGLGWAISTTIATFTDSATAADHTVQVQYL